MTRFLLLKYDDFRYILLRMNNLLTFTDYKAFLRKQMNSTEETLTDLAAAAGCQRSYFSRVLNSEIHLTPEHAFNLAEHWRLQNPQDIYFLTLVDYSRAGTSALKKHLLQKLNQIKNEQESLDRLVNRPRVENTIDLNLYYSAWYWSAIHIATSIPHLQTEEALSQKLGLPLAVVNKCLTVLKDAGYVKSSGKKWVYANGAAHAPAGSTFVVNHHNNWRSRAVLSSQENHQESVHFTVVQSISESSYQKMRQMLLSFIQETAAIAGPSKEEELIVLNCDFFKVIRK